MAEYYVVRDKNTGLYFRGKGVNRWGKYYNQASIYRIKANAENTIKEVSWRGEQAEVEPIQIIENTAEVVPKSEVEKLKIAYEGSQKAIKGLTEMIREKNEELAKLETHLELHHGERSLNNLIAEEKAEVAREIFEEIETELDTFDGSWANTVIMTQYLIAELKKKYTEDNK